MEKHAAGAAAINCSGLDPGPSSNRDLKVNPPLMVSPAVNVPVPVAKSPFHSALPIAGISVSLSFRVVVNRPTNHRTTLWAHCNFSPRVQLEGICGGFGAMAMSIYER